MRLMASCVPGVTEGSVSLSINIECLELPATQNVIKVKCQFMHVSAINRAYRTVIVVVIIALFDFMELLFDTNKRIISANRIVERDNIATVRYMYIVAAYIPV